MSLACSTSAYHLKLTAYLEKSVLEARWTVRWTGMAAASGTGEKLEMFVIGKSKKPRCFKNVKQILCRYRAQKKSWITGVLFEEWARKLDSSFRAQSRKVSLLIDNCPTHIEIKNLRNINLTFLPPNTTSVLQPVDQGVIRSLRAHYRKKFVQIKLFRRLVFFKQ